jgi:putative hydrolase of the HAD superfamily
MDRPSERQGAVSLSLAARERMIKTVFFDASETLIHLPKGVPWHYATVARRHHMELETPTVAAAFKEVWTTMPRRSATRGARENDDHGWWRALVRKVLELCGERPEAPIFDAYFEDLYAHFAEPGVWELYPDVAQTLTELQSRYELGVISNFDGRLRRILRQVGLSDAFSIIAISSEVGADKPHPWIFEEALRLAGVSAEEAVHVGDDPIRDWQGGSAVGLRCFHLTRGKNSLTDLAAWLRARDSH